MEDKDSKVKLGESPIEQSSEHVQQNINIIEEIKNLDYKTRDPNYETFKKTTYWHQQSTTMENLNQEAFQKEIIECLLRIETKLTELGIMLEK